MNGAKFGFAGLSIGRRVIVLIVLALAAGLVVASSGRGRPGYGGEPVIDVRGVVYDHATNKGLDGAYVIVNLMGWHGESITGHGASGCVGGEVVRTDAQGRYRFLWDWKALGKKIPPDVSVQIRAYAPGWEYYPTTRRLSTPWQTPYTPGPDIVMTRDEATFEERIAFIAKLNDNACWYGSGADSWAAMLFAQQREVWNALCRDSLQPSASMPWARYEALERYSVFAAVFAQNLRQPFADETARSIRTGDLRAVARAALPELQRAGPSWEFPFPRVESLNEQQWRLACDAMSPVAVAKWSAQ